MYILLRYRRNIHVHMQVDCAGSRSFPNSTLSSLDLPITMKIGEIDREHTPSRSHCTTSTYYDDCGKNYKRKL